MKTRVQKWGNSLALRIPKSFAVEAGLVLSPSAYNGRVGLALFGPITSQAKGYPFEVALPAGLPVAGADQVKTLDWRARQVARIGAVSEEVVAQVLLRLQTLLTGSGVPGGAADRNLA
jgi:mRNA interferase MazF